MPMNTHMEYEWYESVPFILTMSLLFFLLIPIPIAVYGFLRRLEKQQLSRLIIARILGIDYYRKEIAILKGVEYEERFELEFSISEMAFQQLSKTHESLRREHDELVFQAILNERIQNEVEKVKPNIERLNLAELMKDAEKEKVIKEKKKKESLKTERIRPVVKKDRIVITEEELFEESFADDEFDIFF